MQIAADRFVLHGGGWLDLASGARVRLHVSAAGTRTAQAMWSARCAALANLRHPALNTLVDHGAFDATRTFAAFVVRPPLAGGAHADACLAHAVRFCEAHGIAFERAEGGLAFRPIVPGPAAGVPIGIVLQPRAAIDAVRDALAATAPPGPIQLTLCGAPGTGLRTAGVLAAHMARLAGYVPIASRVAVAYPEVLPAIADRHVCVIDWQGESAGSVVARLPGEGRRHVVLSLKRSPPPGEGAILLDPLSVRALTAMVFVDPDFPPSASAVAEAAHRASGSPGALLARLDALGHETRASAPPGVRETAPVFDGRRSPPTDADTPRRTARTMLAAQRRAERLRARGRHAHAARVLGRAFRVLEARGYAAQAAACALAAGRLMLDRGRAAEAVDWFERARALQPDASTGVRALVEVGEAWLLSARLADAESAFRTAHLAATAMREIPLADDAAAGLVECLCLQGRADEAAALAPFRQRPAADTASVAVARVPLALASGDLPAAVRSARDARSRAQATRDARLIARAFRWLGAALAAAGDGAQAAECLDEGIAHARASRLPIDALRLRAIRAALEHETAGAPATAALRLAERGVPRLVQIELRLACARAADADVDAETRGWMEQHGVRDLLAAGAADGPMVVLERLLERCRGAADDRSGLDAACAELVRRLRAATVLVVGAPPAERVLAQAGRPWPGEPHVARRVLATGLGVAVDPATEPCVGAEPLRFGGEIIGAVACRWTPGTAVSPPRAGAILRVAALAISASVRALLDRSFVQPAASAPGDLLGESPAAHALREAIVRAARAPFPVLIEGESGSGKELVARAIHRLSPRRERRFCPVNCAALTDDLLEAELFGHARGAFTGAVGERAGLFEEADGGTIFLDEIGELSARAQAKLLRVLQDGEVRRVGENHPRRVDIRVVAATNRRLVEEAAAGRFRPDLRFRLDVVRIDVPPLRERAGDVPLLAAHFWADATARVGARATLAPEALSALARYDWPGNVRELQNVIAWMAVHAPSRGRVGVAHLPAHLAQAGPAVTATSFEAARLEFERRFVRATLATANGRRTAAAAALGMTRQGLAKMLKRLGIEEGAGH